MKKILLYLALLCLCVINAEAQETKPLASNVFTKDRFVANAPTFRITDVDANVESSSASRIPLSAEFMRYSLSCLVTAHEEKLKHVESDQTKLDFKQLDFTPRYAASDDDPIPPTGSNNNADQSGGFRWKSAIQQSLIFLAVQHGYAMTQPKTRRDLKGKFFRDYIDSVKSLHGWDDGGRFFTNYIAHPMQGAITGYIQIQNDPKGINQRFGRDRAYWMSRLRAMAWSAAWSTQSELGPISQASIGNVGLHGKQTWEDIVTTPTLGTAMLITEDALDRYLIRAIERRTDNLYIRIFSRMLFNPMRNFSNMLRFKKPWYRDAGHFRD